MSTFFYTDFHFLDFNACFNLTMVLVKHYYNNTVPHSNHVGNILKIVIHSFVIINNLTLFFLVSQKLRKLAEVPLSTHQFKCR